MTGVEASDRWLIALDIDGTLIHPDETVSDAVLEQVRRVEGLGHEVMLATGRSWEGTQPVLERLGLSPEYIVCANGALTMQRDDSEETGYRREVIETFNPIDVLRLIRPHLPEGSFLVEDAYGYRRFTEGMSEWNVDNATLVDFDQLVDFPATRVVVVSPNHDQEDFLAVVERMGLHQVTYSIGWTAWLDIAPQGVSKASALEDVRQRLGIDRNRVLTMGDGRNDITMLEWAAEQGRAVAMGGAPDEVVAVSTEVTGSVYDDGLAHALATF